MQPCFPATKSNTKREYFLSVEAMQKKKANWEKKAIFYCLVYSLSLYIFELIEIKVNLSHVIAHYP